MSSKKALMICTQARGGMRSVVEAYARDGVFERWGFEFLWTHREGSAFLRVVTAAKAYFRLLSLLFRNQISFMHVHAAMRGSFWRKSIFAATARRFGVPSIIHLHGSEMKTFYNSLSASRRLAVRRSLERAEAVIVLSESWREFVSQIAPGARLVVINNYVSLPSPVPLAVPKKEFSVLFLGLLGHRKGIFDLLESWPSILSAIPEARLRVGGNGEVDAAKAKAESLGISNSVEFLGWVDGEQKLDLLKQTDTFVLPSYNEGLPMSVLEAMSWAKPVVTTKVGGIPELVTDQVDGLLIQAGDQLALSSALIRLGRDFEFRTQIGLAGRKRIADRFSDQAVLPLLESVYRQVLNRETLHSSAAVRSEA